MTNHGQLDVSTAGVPDSRDGFKLLGEHVSGCLAAANKDGIAFVVHDGFDFRRKINGDRNGSTMWHRFICNDTKCRAVLLIRWDVLAGFVNQRPDFDPHERRRG